MNAKGSFLLLLVVVALSACATIPTGPNVMVWPGPGKPFEVFQSDDAACRQWAGQRAAPEPFGYEWVIQSRYDNAYAQCMYFKGNQVPGITGTGRRGIPLPPPPPGYTSPPSSAYPPPTSAQPGFGIISPPPATGQVKPNPD